MDYIKIDFQNIAKREFKDLELSEEDKETMIKVAKILEGLRWLKKKERDEVEKKNELSSFLSLSVVTSSLGGETRSSLSSDKPSLPSAMSIFLKALTSINNMKTNINNKPNNNEQHTHILTLVSIP
ncbi:hypothetical protein Scep_019244 [Stephania cephalantha]|uniref:Uncharacterized protein n=1 Tax=Stephania cephalantha TaxID=152367 RepID=A0AAP0IAJ8_9MAGN